MCPIFFGTKFKFFFFFDLNFSGQFEVEENFGEFEMYTHEIKFSTKINETF